MQIIIEEHLLKVFTKNNLSFLILICVLLFCFSCSYKERVPVEWLQESNTKKENIFNISGSYSNVAERVNNKSSYTPSLAWLLFYKDKKFSKVKNTFYFFDRADKVTFEQKNNEKIIITAFKGNEIIAEKTLLKSKGDFNCKNGMITISYIEDIAEAIFMGFKVIKIGFYKKDGHLIAKQTNHNVSIILIPAYYKETTWERFQEI